MSITIPTGPASLRHAALPLLTVAVLALAGCGSKDDSGSTVANDTGQGTGTVVAVSDASGRSVLVDSDGKALYMSDEEKSGKVLCTSGACGAIWTPLTVASKNSLTAPPPLAHQLGTVARPDGSTQVTLGGRPLYTFSFDHSPGQVNGDGTQDSFDGTDFTWHAAKAAGAGSAPSAAPTTSSDGGGYSYP